MTQTSPAELARQFAPPARQLEELTETVDPSNSAPPMLKLAFLTGRTAGLVASLLHNADETEVAYQQHALQILHDVAEQLVAATGSALSDTGIRVPVLHGHCLAKVHLDDAERAWLCFRPYAGNDVPETLPCELEGDHGGPHAACGQMGGEVQWWVHWTLRSSEVSEHRACPATQPNTDPSDPNEVELCLLYSGHPGRHSYAIGA
jgi:hypothetical protein